MYVIHKMTVKLIKENLVKFKIDLDSIGVF